MFSPEYIKQQAAIDHNVYDHEIVVSEKWIIDSVIEPIIGSCLIDKLCQLPDADRDPFSGEWQPLPSIEDEIYYDLKYGIIFDCISWGVRADVGPQLHNKIRNAGVIRSSDEQITNVIQDDLMRNKDRYEARMRFYEERIKLFIENHKNDLPELVCIKPQCCDRCGLCCHSSYWSALYGKDTYNQKGRKVIAGFVV